MHHSLNCFLDRLASQTRLNAKECEAIGSLSGQPEQLTAHSNIVLRGDVVTSAVLVVDGFCGQVQSPTEDKRQITAIYVPGDMANLSSAFQPEATASMEALTAATIVRISHKQIHGIMRTFPAIGEAITRYLIADAAITAEWLVSIGSRAARASVAHLLCEMAVRLDKVQGNSFSFSFPLSQHQFSEVCGLSAVHINRSLMDLRRDGLVRIDKGVARVGDWLGLKTAAHFNSHYLPSASCRLAA